MPATPKPYRPPMRWLAASRSAAPAAIARNWASLDYGADHTAKAAQVVALLKDEVDQVHAQDGLVNVFGRHGQSMAEFRGIVEAAERHVRGAA